MLCFNCSQMKENISGNGEDSIPRFIKFAIYYMPSRYSLIYVANGQ